MTLLRDVAAVAAGYVFPMAGVLAFFRLAGVEPGMSPTSTFAVLALGFGAAVGLAAGQLAGIFLLAPAAPVGGRLRTRRRARPR